VHRPRTTWFFVLAALVALSVTAAGDAARYGRTATTADNTITMAVRAISDMIPEHLCVDKGICAKYGVNLVLQNFTGTSADLAAALQAGSVDTAYLGVTNVLQARQQGFDMVIIASAAGESKQNPSGQANSLLVKDPSIQTGKDLEGKSVAVNGLQSASQAIIMQWVRKTGGDPSKVNWVGTIPDPQKPQAVASGQVAAGHVPEPYRSVGISLGLHTIDAALTIRPQGLWIGAVAAKGATVNANAQLYKNLVRALEESSRMANGDQALAKAELKTYSPLSGAQIDASNLPILDAGVSIGNTNFWKSLINRFFAANVTANPFQAIWSGALPMPMPVVKFVRPKTKVKADASFTVSVTDFKLVPGELGNAPVFDHGFVRYTLDGGKYDRARYAGRSATLAVKVGGKNKFSVSVDGVITYRHLPRGRHTLVARVANNDGSLLGPKATLKFTVR
jgi:NitT/TauT family transport system substrate-binding protein